MFTAALASSLSLGFAQPTSVPKPHPELLEAYSQFGLIIGLEAGGGDHPTSVKLDVPVITSPISSVPPCKIMDAGYLLDRKDPGARFQEAVLLSAFLAGKKVRVLVQGCISEKPEIIAVGIGGPVK